MRNICRLIELSDKLPQDCGIYTLFTVDNINNTVYSVTSTNTFIAYDYSAKKVNVKIELNQQDILTEGAVIVEVQFIPDLESICMASNRGDILMYSTMSHQLECVGVVGSGILCMSWSPDYELFVLATEAETLVLMNKDWDILGEVNIHSLLPGGKLTANIITNSTLPQAIYSQAAYAPSTMAPPTPAASNDQQQPQQPINQYVATPPSISWRGDGQFFVCSSYDASCGRVMLRTWERSLVLHAISEPLITGLESGVAWRPSGSLIACSHRLPNKHEIALFERNGLKHGEFNIRVPGSVVALEWSADSEILAIQMDLAGENKKSVVQIWHRSNYHWFLKHELHYADGDSVACIRWDSSVSILRILTNRGELHEHWFAWDYNSTQGSGSNNPATVCVVDGQQLKMTPFRKLVIPPPMSHYQHQLEGNCSAFDFSQQDYSIAVLTVDNSISIYSGDSAALKKKLKVPTSTIRLDHLRHLVWVPSTTNNENTIHLVAVDGLSSTSDQIVEIVLNNSSNELSITNIHRTVSPGRVIRLIKHLEISDLALFETNDGAVYNYHLQSGVEHSDSITPYIQHESGVLFKFPTVCSWFAITKIAGEEVLVGLNERNKLYVNQTVLASDCNSFALHNKFLLYTTVSHVLRSIPLSVPLNTTTQASTPLNTNSSPTLQSQEHNNNNRNTKPQHQYHPKQTVTTYDDSTRDVERGSRIAVVVPHDTRVVLQMPRGNLEAISPRSLTLSTIREQLNEHQYGKVFSTMRRNRIDMNFIYDHNPADFIKHIDIFVQQIPQIDYLNLFITSLRDQDTSKTLFIDLENPASAPQKSALVSKEAIGEAPGKVNLICDKLREVFVRVDQNRFIQPVLTTYVKKSPPELDEALRLIQTLRGLEEVSEHGETIVNRLAEESLDYIVFLVDVNKLYDVALGTYDFDLVLMVAQKSQKDPKEYIAFLKELQSMEINYQRYTIDKHLERWPKALANLALAGDDHLQDCYDLTTEKQLYHDALRVFAKRPQELKVVQELYGDYLMQNNRFEEAAYLYYQAENHKKSLQSFKDAGKWRMALKEARELKYTPEELKALCDEMADHLRRASKFADSAALYAQHCHDIENALHSLSEGNLWVDAYDLAIEHNRKDLIDSVVGEQLLESFKNHLKEIEDNIETYTKSFTRLGVVRTQKMNHVPLRLMPGQLGANDPETSSMMSGMSGMFSENSMGSMNSSSTTSSFRSTYSSATGTFSQATRTRNKKKDPSKKKVNKIRVTGKEGSAHEEEFIVDAMKKMMPTVSQQQVIGNLLRGLVLLGWGEKAEQLQITFQKFIELIKQSLDLLSQSSTAIHPDNVKEQQRIYEFEYQRLVNQQQENNNNNNNNNNENTASDSVVEKMTIKQIIVSFETSKWELNIF